MERWRPAGRSSASRSAGSGSRTPCSTARRALPGDRARAHERPRDRQIQDQLVHLHCHDRLRPPAVDPDQVSRSSTPRSPVPSIPRSSTSSTSICRSAPCRSRWRRRLSSRFRRSCPWPRHSSPIRRFRPSRKRGAVLFEEKRLGVDVLDAIVVVGCLGTMSIFPGAVLCWCLELRPRVWSRGRRTTPRSCS